MSGTVRLVWKPLERPWAQRSAPGVYHLRLWPILVQVVRP